MQIGNLVYFIAADGIYVTDGQQMTPIGHGKVDSTVFSDLSQNYADRMRGGVDPANKLILWSYCSGGNVSGICDRVAAYNYAEGKFMPVNEGLSLMFTTKRFVFIVFNNYILAPYLQALFSWSVSLQTPPDLWALNKIGLGGYVLGRSA